MTLQLHSPAFDDGNRIPSKYGYTETNVNPPLEVSGVPSETNSLALIVDDPDAMEPAGKIWDHWVVWNIDPDRERIPEDWDVSEASEGRTDYGETGYGGPNPPDREHTYRFRLRALDTTVDLGPGATTAELESAIEGHVIEEALLEGTYAP
ncbi:MAG: YbhB/YbcL family Raf kinase inhibitor-like protein [Halodesulfurarchaeum sp.]